MVEILDRIAREPYHWPVGRTTFQKIAYFATAAGLPSGLTYERGSYGPFAPGLKAVMSVLTNQGLVQEEHLGRMAQSETGSDLSGCPPSQPKRHRALERHC